MTGTTKAAQKAVNKYISKNYDRINLTVPKGKKDKIKAHADSMGESVNSYINRLIDEDMEGLKEACDQAIKALKEVETALKEMGNEHGTINKSL